MRSLRRREVDTVSLKQVSSASPVEPRSQQRAHSAQKGSWWAELFLVVIGALLLVLAGGDELGAIVVPSGGSGSVLRGTDGSERLATFGGEDVIWALAGDDELHSGEGNGELYGGEGRDVILGGAGDDFIEAKDGEVDFVGCGLGDDVASVDLLDRVSRDCETIYPG
jgi:Ca2+-binding RTX toxin-like protein